MVIIYCSLSFVIGGDHLLLVIGVGVNVVKRYGKAAGVLFKKAAFAYTTEQYEKCKQDIKA